MCTGEKRREMLRQAYRLGRSGGYEEGYAAAMAALAGQAAPQPQPGRVIQMADYRSDDLWGEVNA